MIRYFFDEATVALIAYDEETKTARPLLHVSFESGSVPGSNFTNEKLFPKRKYTKQSDKKKPSKTGGCEECGSPSRHKSSCSRAGAKSRVVGNQNWQELGEVSASRSHAMTRMQYGRVKIANSHDIPPSTIASNLSVSEAEVNKAILAETFDDYLKA